MSFVNTSPDASKQLKNERVYIDPRPFYKQILDELSYWPVSLSTIAVGYLTLWYTPALLLIYLPLLVTTTIVAITNREYQTLPIHLPKKCAPRKDYHHNQPGRRFKYEQAKGTVYLGRELYRKEREVWLWAGKLLTHTLLLGSTGAGKSETLLSQAAIAFLLGGSVNYVDAKGAVNIILALFALARYFGREDDVRILSYKTGNVEVKTRHWKRKSNTCSIFSQGSASVVQQVLEDMMPDSSGENQVFRDKAVAALKVLLPSIMELRDGGWLNISPSILAQAFSLRKMIQIAYPEHHGGKLIFIRDSTGEEIEIPNKVSKPKIKGVRRFLESLSEFSDDPAKLQEPNKQSPETSRSFSFADSYLVKPLAELSATMSHIFEAELGELDFKDGVLNNRVTGVIIPATELSGDTKEMSGKLALSGIRIALATGLGPESEGNVEDLIDNLPVDLAVPSILIIDEYPECAVKNFASAATQGRGLGLACTFSGQDLGGFIRASEEETKMIFGSTRIKILMAIEDINETFEWFRKNAGTMRVAESQGWQEGGELSRYKQNFSATIKEIDKLDFLAVKSQVEGEAFVMESNRTTQVNLFYTALNYKKAENFRFNRMLQVRMPTAEQVKKIKAELEYSLALEYALDNDELPKKSKKDLLNLEQIDVTADTKWIYELINKSGEFDPEADRVAQILNTSPANQNQEKHGDDVAQGNKDVTVEQRATPNQAIRQNKQLKMDAYITDYKLTESSLTETSKIESVLNQISIKAGCNPAVAQKYTKETIEKMKKETRYTTINIEPEPEDLNSVYAAIDALSEDEDN